LRRLVSWALGNLDENLALLDHAQLVARPLLDGVITLLEIADFGIKTGVPDFELSVALLLQL